MFEQECLWTIECLGFSWKHLYQDVALLHSKTCCTYSSCTSFLYPHITCFDYIYILFLHVFPIFLTRSSTFVNGSYQGGALSWSRKWLCPAFGGAICTSLCKAIRMIMVHIFYAPLFSLFMIQSLLYGCFGSWKSSLGLYIYKSQHQDWYVRLI
jgi:hypothetical protein